MPCSHAHLGECISEHLTSEATAQTLWVCAALPVEAVGSARGSSGLCPWKQRALPVEAAGSARGSSGLCPWKQRALPVEATGSARGNLKIEKQ